MNISYSKCNLEKFLKNHFMLRKIKQIVDGIIILSALEKTHIHLELSFCIAQCLVRKFAFISHFVGGFKFILLRATLFHTGAYPLGSSSVFRTTDKAPDKVGASVKLF